MAFDRNNTAHLVALRDEESLDPIGMGYAATGGNTQQTLDLFNLSSNNVGLEIDPAALLADDLIGIMFDIAVNSQDQFVIQSLLEITSSEITDISRFRAQLSNLSVGFATAITNHTRQLSRMDVLFGIVDSNGVHETVIISKDDWFAARDHVGV